MAMTDFRIGDFHGKRWAVVEPDGRLSFIDWDEAERLAEEFRSHRKINTETSIACLVLAVRDYVISVNIPPLPPRPGVRK